MKIIRHDWEGYYLNKSVCRILLSYDNVSLVENFKRIRIKNSSVLGKNIDQTKLLSLGFVFSNNSKTYLGLTLNRDKNPLKKTVNKSTNTKNLIGHKNDLESISYVVFIYLYNYFFNKNIVFAQKVRKDVFNIKIDEINSILKVGHPYNILDLDPSVQFNFVEKQNTKKLLEYCLDKK